MSGDAEETPMGETNPQTGGHGEGATDDPRWLDQPGAVDKVIGALCLLCVLSVVPDFFYHKHGHWHFQEIFAFDAFYGFVGCVGLVLAAKLMRVLLMRSEDYYD